MRRLVPRCLTEEQESRRTTEIHSDGRWDMGAPFRSSHKTSPECSGSTQLLPQPKCSTFPKKKKITACVFLHAEGVIHGVITPRDTKIKANIARDRDICHEVPSYTIQHMSGTGVLAVVWLGTSGTSNQ
jgi:hypothetical protein